MFIMHASNHIDIVHLKGVWYVGIGNENNILFPFLFLSGMEWIWWNKRIQIYY